MRCKLEGLQNLTHATCTEPIKNSVLKVYFFEKNLLEIQEGNHNKYWFHLRCLLLRWGYSLITSLNNNLRETQILENIILK